MKKLNPEKLTLVAVIIVVYALLTACSVLTATVPAKPEVY